MYREGYCFFTSPLFEGYLAQVSYLFYACWQHSILGKEFAALFFITTLTNQSTLEFIRAMCDEMRLLAFKHSINSFSFNLAVSVDIYWMRNEKEAPQPSWVIRLHPPTSWTRSSVDTNCPIHEYNRLSEPVHSTEMTPNRLLERHLLRIANSILT